MFALRFPARSVIAFGTVSVLLSSCSLDAVRLALTHPELKAGTPLQAGVKYEVRKAMPVASAMKPQDMKRYYFVYEPPKPPLKNAGLRPDEMSRMSPGDRITVRTTAYCHDERDHLAYGARNALGTNLKFGSLRSAAADWSRYPVGTLFRIAGQPDVIYEVDDYGSALVGTGTIDLYKPNRTLMNDWGVRNVDIEVIRWGSYQRSLDIMRERTRWPHVRRMMEEISDAAVSTSVRKGAFTASL